LIVKSVESARKTVTHSQLSHLSTVDQIFWCFIASCCKQFKLSANDLPKLLEYFFIIENFSKIYADHCQKVSKECPQPICEVPDSIKTISNDDVKYYFKWIYDLQNIYIHWHGKFQKDDYNFDEILDYMDSLSVIRKFKQLLNISGYIFEPGHMGDFKKRFVDTYTDLCLFLVKESKGFDK